MKQITYQVTMKLITKIGCEVGKIIKGAMPVLTVILGAAIALAGTYATNYSSIQKDYQAERRQKLEILVADLFESDRCELDYERGGHVRDACAAGTATGRSIAYAGLYFPELYQLTMNYQVELEKRKLDFTQCLANSVSETEKESAGGWELLEAGVRVKCLQDISKKKRADIDPLLKQARQTGLSLQPSKSMLWPFSSWLESR
jgi:hypothetical protein